MWHFLSFQIIQILSKKLDKKIYILTLKFGNKFRHNSLFFGYRNSEATSCYGQKVVSLDERKQIGKVQD